MIKRMDPEDSGTEAVPFDLDALNRCLAEISHKRNTTADPEMGGLSPEQVMRLVYTPWGEPESPIQFNAGLTLNDAESSPFFRNARIFLCAVRDADGVKATANGNLSQRFVGEMMELMLSEERCADIRQVRKTINEENVYSLHAVRIVAQVAGLVRIRKGRFIVPKGKRGMLEPERVGDLFRVLFLAFFVKLNLTYLTRYGPEAKALQAYAAYTLYRLGVVAGDWHAIDHLPEEVLLPAVRSEVEAEIMNPILLPLGDLLESRLIGPLMDWGLLEGRYEHVKSPHYKTLVAIRVTPLYRDFLRFHFE